MEKTRYLAMTGIKKAGQIGFKTKTATDGTDQLRPSEPPRAEPHLIHGGPGRNSCSECGYPVNIPAGNCGTCNHCGAQFGGCG